MAVNGAGRRAGLRSIAVAMSRGKLESRGAWTGQSRDRHRAGGVVHVQHLVEFIGFTLANRSIIFRPRPTGALFELGQ